MTLSRKHYKAIAEILRYEHDAQNDTYGDMRTGIALKLAWYFESDNPRFDYQRFMDASIPETEA